jgi:hypothetical protein
VQFANNPPHEKCVTGVSSSQGTLNALPADLAEVNAAWAALPEALKAGILAMVRTSGTTAGGAR